MFTGIPWGHVGYAIGSALLVLVLNPLLYIGFGLTIWDYSRNGSSERKFFGVRVTKAIPHLLRLWAHSLILGLAGTVLACLAGFVVTSKEIAFVTGISIILGVIRLRFLSPIYGIACAIGLSELSRIAHIGVPNGVLAAAWDVLRNFHTLSWLGLSAFTLLLQGLALWMHRKRDAFPVTVLSKRGRSIGAFAVKLSFIVPICIPSPGTVLFVGDLPHAWPWFAPQGSVSLVALPLVIGYSGLFSTSVPRNGLKRLWANDLLTGVLVGIVVCVAYEFGAEYALVGAVLAIAVKEWVLWLMRMHETRYDPLFVPSPDGVRVLSVVKGSLAHSMGLLPGEVITHVNQVPVHTPYDLHFAFDQNPAYAKLQVVDMRGETRFVGNPVYSGERNKLGLILVPDSYDGACYQPVSPGLFHTCYLRMARHVRGPEEAWLEAASGPPGN